MSVKVAIVVKKLMKYKMKRKLNLIRRRTVNLLDCFNPELNILFLYR